MVWLKKFIFVCLFRNLLSYDYCVEQETECKPGMKHIGCANEVLTGKGAINIPHTRKFIDLIKFEHDKIRNSVACGVYQTSKYNKEKYPKASKMKGLEWDYELAYLSKRIASTCDDSFEFNYCFQSARFPPLGFMSYFSHKSIKFSQTSRRNPIPRITKTIRNWPKDEVGPKDEIVKEANAASSFYYTDFYSMIGDHENGTNFACTFSYCPDLNERDAVREVFICLYSWKYTQDNIVYEIGDSGENCKPDPNFQCLCDGGGITGGPGFKVLLLFSVWLCNNVFMK